MTARLCCNGARSTRSAEGPFRLAVDRVFLQKDHVVITGIVIPGACGGRRADLLQAGRRVRVRDLASARNAKKACRAAALALQGVKLEEIERGDTLASPGRFVDDDGWSAG
jgi:selenocysteine-specific translation elongation factor